MSIPEEQPLPAGAVVGPAGRPVALPLAHAPSANARMATSEETEAIRRIQLLLSTS
jgi:hypothetical protein